MRYVALIHGDEEPGFGVSFPDFPGCVSDGDTEEEAIRRGREALTFHIENMAEDGEGIPRPSACSEIEANPDLAEWLEGARMVEIEVDQPPRAIVRAHDRLVRDVGEIFGRRLARFIEPSVVPDLPEDDWGSVKVALLLESPGSDETQASRPLVGRSGTSAAKGLRENVPSMHGLSGALGNLVADGDHRVSCLGIMNASRLPLKADHYRANGVDRAADIPAWCEFDRALRYVKDDSKCPRPVTERNEAALLLERAVVADLQERLDEIPDGADFLLVCCGALAQRMFERTQPRATIRVAYARHPSNRWWQRCPGDMKNVYDGIAHMLRIRGRSTASHGTE